MGRHRRDDLPKHLYLSTLNYAYYYKHPGMPKKANLGKDRATAIQMAKILNTKYRTELEQRTMRLEAAIDLGSPRFATAFEQFVEKYIEDYRLKQSTAALLHQRRKRISKQIGDVQVAAIDTQMLREAIAGNSQFEQSKMRTLLLRFFRYAKSNGDYPSHLVNPADDLFVDPVPHKQRHRLTLEQFKAIYRIAPQWLQWVMTLGLHLALRRVDLVNLRFSDIVGGRIISPIRKTDTEAREIEETSVDFPIHPDVQHVITEARRSSLRVGRCPFIVHRVPERRTKRAADALGAGRMEHPAQILPDYATKAFNSVRQVVCRTTDVFAGLSGRQLPTLHEIRALSSHLYAKAGFDVWDVQDLMAHTDPDMTRAYQKGHARKVLRVEMMLPYSVTDDDSGVREEAPVYAAPAPLAA